MNVYDFDGTIYDGDSSIDFYLFNLKKDCKLVKFFPHQIKAIILYKMKKISKESLKSTFFSFISNIPDINNNVKEFWNLNEKKIKNFYKKQHRKDDCVISASPFFLLKEICNRLDIQNLIATKVDSTNGKLISCNCHDCNKPIFFKNEFGEQVIENFYSDSYTDEPMKKIAEKSYIVKGNKIKDWE